MGKWLAVMMKLCFSDAAFPVKGVICPQRIRNREEEGAGQHLDYWQVLPTGQVLKHKFCYVWKPAEKCHTWCWLFTYLLALLIQFLLLYRTQCFSTFIPGLSVFWLAWCWFVALCTTVKYKSVYLVSCGVCKHFSTPSLSRWQHEGLRVWLSPQWAKFCVEFHHTAWDSSHIKQVCKSKLMKAIGRRSYIC